VSVVFAAVFLAFLSWYGCVYDLCVITWKRAYRGFHRFTLNNVELGPYSQTLSSG